jgi:tetratricopeptide (TPR) repeat protein
METLRLRSRAWLVLTALLAAAVPLAAAPVQKADDEAQRRRALALNDVTGDDPIDGHIKSLAADPDGSRKLLAAAVAMTKDKPQPFNYNAAYILARTAEELKDLNAGRTFYEICAKEALKLKSRSKLGQSYGGLIELLFDNKKYAEAEKVCKQVLELPDEDRSMVGLKAGVMSIMIRAVAKQGKTDEALKMLDNYVKAMKDNWQFALQLKAMVLREVGQTAKAAQTYELLIKKIRQDKDIDPEDRAKQLERYHYLLSSVYIDLNNVDKAAEHLKILLSQKPDDPTFNNDLGYIWADHDMNLDEAEKMIRKALAEDRKQRQKDGDEKADADKDNAAFLDSLGWVLYKKKQYKAALAPLLKAVKDKEGQHIEIFDHLGDVYMALGDKPEAVKAWKKGLDAVGDAKRELEKKAQVEKKIKAAEAE